MKQVKASRETVISWLKQRTTINLFHELIDKYNFAVRDGKIELEDVADLIRYTLLSETRKRAKYP